MAVYCKKCGKEFKDIRTMVHTSGGCFKNGGKEHCRQSIHLQTLRKNIQNASADGHAQRPLPQKPERPLRTVRGALRGRSILWDLIQMMILTK